MHTYTNVVDMVFVASGVVVEAAHLGHDIWEGRIVVTSCGVWRTLQGVRSILCHYPRWILLALVSDRREVEKDSSAPDAVYMTVRLEGATAPSSVFSSRPDGSNDN